MCYISVRILSGPVLLALRYRNNHWPSACSYGIIESCSILLTKNRFVSEHDVSASLSDCEGRSSHTVGTKLRFFSLVSLVEL